MPIDEEEWDMGKGAGTKEIQILEFLRENKPTAYNKYEIGHEVFGHPLPDESDSFGKQFLSVVGAGVSSNFIEKALANLVESDKVKRKEVDTVPDVEDRPAAGINDSVYYRAK